VVVITNLGEKRGREKDGRGLTLLSHPRKRKKKKKKKKKKEESSEKRKSLSREDQGRKGGGVERAVAGRKEERRERTSRKEEEQKSGFLPSADWGGKGKRKKVLYPKRKNQGTEKRKERRPLPVPLQGKEGKSEEISLFPPAFD